VKELVIRVLPLVITASEENYMSRYDVAYNHIICIQKLSNNSVHIQQLIKINYCQNPN